MIAYFWEVSTQKFHTYPSESEVMNTEILNMNRTVSGTPLTSPNDSMESDPELDALVREIIGRVADKWTMLVLETLEDHGRLRFTRLGDLIGGVSQKMLTKTIRQMEADGLVSRTVYPVIPPRVEYELTELGRELGAAFCGVWVWAERHRAAIEAARKAFKERPLE
jgi:DNA-binding HxlR family transcriptional regulator